MALVWYWYGAGTALVYGWAADLWRTISSKLYIIKFKLCKDGIEAYCAKVLPYPFFSSLLSFDWIV